MRKPGAGYVRALCVAALLAVMTLPAWAGESRTGDEALRILAGPKGGQWLALATDLAEFLREAGIPAEASVGGGVENLKLVGDGEADVAFTLYSFMGAAGAGEKELPSVNLDNAVLLANLYPQVLYIIVRKEVAEKYNLRNLGDLLKVQHSIRFSTLPKGTGSEFIFNMLLKSAFQTNYESLGQQGWDIAFESYANISKRFLAGDLDVCAYTAGPGTYLIPALEHAKLDAVLLPVEEEMLDLMTHQFMTITYIIRPGDYQSVTEDVLTLGDYSSLVVQNTLDDDTVTAINRILWENRQELALTTKDILELSPRFAIAGQSKIHPASVAFWSSPAMEALKSQPTK